MKEEQDKLSVLFTTEFKTSPSTVMFRENLAKLPRDRCRIDFFNRNYANYDVILFMGYDPDIEGARSQNPRAKIGVLDPRPQANKIVAAADFVVANGLEMRDFHSNVQSNFFDYYIYPIIEHAEQPHPKKDPKTVVIGYHGNKVHLEHMRPRITAALERLAESFTVELWAIYNRAALGEWTVGLPDPRKVSVRHIQWSDEVYSTELSQVDIGIVPNLGKARLGLWREAQRPQYSKGAVWRDIDYLLRFKATSNAGRVFPFAQLKIPVVCDMYPSALQIIRDGENGFVAFGTAKWFNDLQRLAADPGLRKQLGETLSNEFRDRYSPEAQNERLVQFLHSVGPNKSKGFRDDPPLDRTDPPAVVRWMSTLLRRGSSRILRMLDAKR